MTEPTPRPDFGRGVALTDLPEGTPVAGSVGDADVVVVRRGDDVFAVGAHCTHYHGPLARGLVVGDTIRCPLHHACFSLRTGEALRAPAFDPVACHEVERHGDRVFVRGPRPAVRAPASAWGSASLPASVVIVGGGAAGFAAAEMLRRHGYDRPITMISADADAPCDRPNLSKDFLAGEAEASWMPLREEDYYRDQRIDLVLDTRVSSIDAAAKMVRADDGRAWPYGALLLATGADPVRLSVPGAAAGEVMTLRTWADSRAIVARAESASRVLVIGASFIGLEVAASLRTRGLDVHVVAPDTQPLARVLGEALGEVIRTAHEQHGVAFHLGATVSRLDGGRATLSTGTAIDGVDLVVAGVGVRPNVALAQDSGVEVDNGVLVNEFLETRTPGVYAAGDIARWPDRRSGEHIRVEHWVVATRQGQTAARNMLGAREPFDAVPFFWSRHYDFAVHYVGHAARWDAVDVEGNLAARKAIVSYRLGGRVLAVATIGRAHAGLEAEARMERE